MIRADMIPDEVVEAGAKAAYENQRTRKWDRCGYVGQQQLRRDARAAIAAALNAWPGAQKDRVFLGVLLDGVDNRITRLCLPLPQEPQ
jgi:hypothetical protein